MALEKGAVEPNRSHVSDWPGAAVPLRVEMGTSSSGVRIPPRALPSELRRMVGFEPEVNCSRGACGGGVPVLTHRLNSEMAASSTKCCGPELGGAVQPMMDRGVSSATISAA